MKYFQKSDGALVPLSVPVRIDGRWVVQPTLEQAAALHAYPRSLVVSAPSPAEGEMPYALEWQLQDGEWRRVWQYKPVPAPGVAEYDEAMESHLLQERAERGYTTREPDAYLASANPRWAQDARDWVAHRDAVMEYALEMINAVQSGQRQPPTLDEFASGLPGIVWTYDENQEDA